MVLWEHEARCEVRELFSEEMMLDCSMINRVYQGTIITTNSLNSIYCMLVTVLSALHIFTNFIFTIFCRRWYSPHCANEKTEIRKVK